ncbi:pali-domain-containing protein [Pleurotus eryngii]|uniref:Pali-domain-containing protein n=1 Tax=Pleurotus eryngii TaxID=5323 RepID=A0A9P6A9L0_PLEER|nr:pali-domain-containing protein [Pleurotus eryngii]
MSRIFCIPGIIFLLCAFVLSFLTSISLPYLPALDITRVHFGNAGTAGTLDQGVTELRLGVWAYCSYDVNDSRTCSKAGHGYNVGIGSVVDKNTNVIIGSSWTRGLAVHPVATAITFVALLLSFSQHITVTLVSSIVSFFAALLTLIAFAIDIALFVYVRHQVKKINGIDPNTNAGPGFWLTLVTFILLLLAGGTVCFGRRKDRLSGATTTTYTTSEKKPFWSRFKRKN